MLKERIVEVPCALDFGEDGGGKGFVGKILKECRLTKSRYQLTLFAQLF